MMNDLEEFLVRNFSIEVSKSQGEVLDQGLELEKILTLRIKHFIRYDLDRLMQILYRLDVNDRDTGEAFNLSDIDLVSAKLSKNIIQRQIKKIEYSSNFKGD